MSKETNLQPLLVRASGPLAGARCPIRDQVIRIGRGPQNDVVIADTAKVSVRHCEIRREGSFFRVYDLNSTNGTYVNGERVTEATLESSCSIRLGADGPELTFILNDGRSEAEDGNAVNLNQTIADPPPRSLPGSNMRTSDSLVNTGHEDLLAKAVTKARMARRKQTGDQTVVIMREMLRTAVHQTRTKFRRWIAVLTLVLLTITASALWQISELKKEKRIIDSHIRDVEARLEKVSRNEAEADELVERLDKYQDRARDLENTGSVAESVGRVDRVDVEKESD